MTASGVTGSSIGDILIKVLGYGILVALALLIMLVILQAVRFPPVVNYFARLRRNQTRKHQRIADRLGMRYAQDDDFGLLDLPLSLMSWGMKRWIHQVTYGSYRGRDVWLFRLYYTVPGGKYGPSVASRRGVVARIDAAFPHVVIERRGILEAKQWIQGIEEMHLDPAFDEEFRVRSTDPELTAEILDANVRRWMVGLPKEFRFEISGPWVLAYEEASREHADERGMLETVSDLADRIPWILTQQHPAGSEPDPDPLRVGPPQKPAKERSRAGRVVGVVATVLVVGALGGVVWAISQGNSDDPCGGPCPTVSVAVPTIDLPSFAPPSISIPPVGEPSPTITPTVEATRGDAVDLAGIVPGEQVTVTFLGLVPTPHPTPPAGGHGRRAFPLGAEFRIENTGSVPYEDFPATGITLVDTDGREFSPSLLDAFKPGFHTIHLAPGEHVHGFVTFEFPATSTPAAILFTADSDFGPQTGRWAP